MEIFQSTNPALVLLVLVDTHSQYVSFCWLVVGSVLGVVFPEENSSQD